MSTSSVGSTTGSAIYDAINTANQASSTSKANSATSAAQDRFLTLLTAQLKNQDPLNPLDNAQMTSQLAQISTVDGITQLNATLQSLLNNSTGSQTLQAAALVGKNVLVPGSGLLLQKGQSYGGVDLPSASNDVVATIVDASGNTVRTLDLGPLPAGTSSFSWNGATDNGSTAADGTYSIRLTAMQGGNQLNATALELGTVSSVANSPNGVSLTVGGLGTLSLSDVKQIF
jgi:flagellar basal-body rod modification protein FlgD